MENDKVIKRGQVFNLDTHGLVKFVRIDCYYGQYTAQLEGIDHPGRYYPKLSTLIEKGYTIIDS